MSELTRRILFVIVAAPVALTIMFAGGASLAAFLAVTSAIAAWEFFRIARAAGHEPLSEVGSALAGLVPLAVHARYLGLIEPRFSYIACVLLLLLAAAIWMRPPGRHPIAAVATTTLGVLYTGGLFSFAYAIHYHDYAAGGVMWGRIPVSAGGALLALPVLITWATDIGAFAVGRRIGGRKLIPSVSPGKTLSGAVGGVVFAVIIAALYIHYVLRPVAQLGMRTAGIIAFGVVLSVAGQVGDLVESLFKRDAGVKDSGTLLPGHGGMLDRIDSLLFVMPAAYLLLTWLLIPAPR
jgi:phosphatidate cytidylyltransferase